MDIEQLTALLVNIAEQYGDLARRGRFYSQEVWEDNLTAAASAAADIYGDSLPSESRTLLQATLARVQPLGASGGWLVDGDGNVTKP